MGDRFAIEEIVEEVPMVLPLDRDTMSWLAKLAKGDDQKAAEIVASMIRSIRVDDEYMHRKLH